MAANQSGAGDAHLGPGKRHFRLSTVLIVLLMCFGSVSFAYAGGVIATTLGQPSFYGYMDLATSSNEEAIIGATSSVFYVGGFLGSIFSNWVGDRFGRKKAIFVGAVLVLLSAALCAGSVHIAMFIVFRFTGGWGAFMLAMSVPLWILESVPPEVRGAFAQLHGVAVNVGYLLSSYVGVGFYVNIHSPLGAWRGPQAIGCIPCIPVLLGIWFVPESPRYLLMKGRDQEAWDIVCRFHSTTNDANHEYAKIEMFQMRRQVELDRTLPASWLEMMRRSPYWKRMLMAIFLGFALQSAGSQTIAIYATTLFKNLGFSTEKQLYLQAGMFAVNLPFTSSCVFYTERFRRQTLITFGLGLLIVALSCYTALTATYLNSGSKSGQIGAVAMIYFFLAAYSGTVEGPFYYYSSEFFPTHLRAKGMTLQATTAAWTSILWAQASPTAIENIGWRYFLIFIALTTCCALFIYFYYPDTRGKSLEEIAALFGDDDLVVVYRRDIHLEIVNDQVEAVAGQEGKADTWTVETVA
ncbi:hypothetical protein CLAIMM_09763 [Cladophialophora immunda]|nr:hypothetical protein CLAIMM_09763 [Cladophialophora immunda]